MGSLFGASAAMIIFLSFGAVRRSSSLVAVIIVTCLFSAVAVVVVANGSPLPVGHAGDQSAAIWRDSIFLVSGGLAFLVAMIIGALTVFLSRY